ERQLPAHHDPRRQPGTQRGLLHPPARHEGVAPARRAGRQVHAGVPRLRRRQRLRRRRDRADLQLRHGTLRAGHRLRPPRGRRARRGRGGRSGARRRRQGHARARPGEVRHHDDRLRRGPGRLQDRADRAPL
ncbi:MAG: Lactoylglutathione lyase, partial [uncultured Acetobacteraceae bacterium]